MSVELKEETLHRVPKLNSEQLNNSLVGTQVQYFQRDYESPTAAFVVQGCATEKGTGLPKEGVRVMLLVVARNGKMVPVQRGVLWRHDTSRDPLEKKADVACWDFPVSRPSASGASPTGSMVISDLVAEMESLRTQLDDLVNSKPKAAAKRGS